MFELLICANKSNNFDDSIHNTKTVTKAYIIKMNGMFVNSLNVLRGGLGKSLNSINKLGYF